MLRFWNKHTNWTSLTAPDPCLLFLQLSNMYSNSCIKIKWCFLIPMCKDNVEGSGYQQLSYAHHFSLLSFLCKRLVLSHVMFLKWYLGPEWLYFYYIWFRVHLSMEGMAKKFIERNWMWISARRWLLAIMSANYFLPAAILLEFYSCIVRYALSVEVLILH